MAITKREEFGRLLKEKRLAAGLTQAEVSKAFDWSTPQFLSNIERGIALPPVTNLKKFANLYKVSAEDLYQHMEEAAVEIVTRDLQRRFKSARS